MTLRSAPRTLAAVLALGALGALGAATATAQTPAETLAAEFEPEQLYLDAYAAFIVNDFANARALALEAAARGHMRANVLAGRLVERGLGGEADVEQAVRLFRAAAREGDGEALAALGLLAREGRGGLAPWEAQGFLRRAADAGQDDALVELAMLYIDGVGVERDPTQARVILGQAALDGSVVAQRALGMLLLTDARTSEGAQAEAHEAETWLTSAADAGDTDAAYALGVAYSTGDVLAADDERAARYLRIAADAGDPAAAADYGLLVYQGRGVEQSFADAADHFRRAAEGGDQEGRFLYAFVLAKGEGVERDLEEAYYWALRSAELGASVSLNYELDRIKLISALERELPEDAQERVRTRADGSGAR